MSNRLWLLLTMVSCVACFAAGCTCGDDDDDDDDNDDNDDTTPADDDSFSDDDTAPVDCSQSGFQYLCLLTFMGQCVEAFEEDNFDECVEYCESIDSRPVGVDDDYCVCCSWF